MPLANNMTCAGNLISFNSGGYKALSRSLNIQVLLTETTLLHQEDALRKLSRNVMMISCQTSLHPVLGINM